MSNIITMFMSFVGSDNCRYYMKGTSDDDCLDKLKTIYPHLEFDSPRVIPEYKGKN